MTVRVATTGKSIEELLRPVAPRDDWSFDQLRDGYNYRQTADWVRLFVRLVAKECRALPKPCTVLDIGCGVGIGRSKDYLLAVRREVEALWGIEPDPSVKDDDGVFDHFQNASMETAKLPASHFDLAFSFMVMEHVADPLAYMRAVSACMKPGGVHFFVTVNSRHYFTRCAKFFKATGLEDAALRVLRGKKEVEDYHYPVQYKCNHEHELAALAEQTGFGKPEFAYVEEDGPRPYFPLVIRPVWWMLAQKRAMGSNPKNLLTMYCKMRKQ